MSTENATLTDDSLDLMIDDFINTLLLLIAISAQALAQLGDAITVPQLRTLMVLDKQGPINLATLAGLLSVQPSATGRMVDRLVSAGLIDRLPHPTSRRELLAALTPRGRDIVGKINNYRRAEFAKILERMPPAERDGLVRGLAAFIAARGEPPAVTYLESMDP